MQEPGLLCVTDLLPYILLALPSTCVLQHMAPVLKAPALALGVQEHQHPSSQKHKRTKTVSVPFQVSKPIQGTSVSSIQHCCATEISAIQTQQHVSAFTRSGASNATAQIGEHWGRSTHRSCSLVFTFPCV